MSCNLSPLYSIILLNHLQNSLFLVLLFWYATLEPLERKTNYYIIIVDAVSGCEFNIIRTASVV